MIEDFLPCSSKPLSSVAHQFLVNVASISSVCSSPPRFINPTLPQGTCVNIPPGTNFRTQLIASSGCSNVTISSIKLIAPIGTTKGGLHQMQGTNNYYTNVTWMPTDDQQNDTHFLCFVAVSSEDVTSEQSCIKLVLAAGYHPPVPIPESTTPNHQLVYPSNNTLQIMFDGKIQCPSKSALIRFYKLGEMLVYQIDASSSLEVNFNGPNLTIVPDYVFTEGSTYYVNFDEGVIQSVKGCMHSDPVLNETFWNFEVLNLTSGKRYLATYNITLRKVYCKFLVFSQLFVKLLPYMLLNFIYIQQLATYGSYTSHKIM